MTAAGGHSTALALTATQRAALARLSEAERRELARRIEARARRLELAARYDSPLALTRALDPQFRSTPAHERINEALVDLGVGSLRLIVTMGSQLGKSTFIMRWDSLWRLARTPTLRIAVVAYQQGLASVPTRLVRDTVITYGAAALVRGGTDVLGLLLSPAKRTETEWELVDGGGMLAAGVTSGLTGRPAGMLKYDDPYADRAEAYSPTIRATVWNHWQYVGRERLAPGSPVVVCHCIMAGMRVLTGDGRWTRVEDVRPGDTVVSLSGGGTGVETAKVTASRLSGHDPTYTVTTDRLFLAVNGRHPFAVLRSGFRPRTDRVEWVRADELRPGDVVVTAKSLPDDYVPDDVLPDGSPVDADLAWLLGYLLGDGWVTAHRRRHQAGRPVSYAVCVAPGSSTRPGKAGLPARVRRALDDWSPNRVYDTRFGYLRTDWNAGGRLLSAMGYGAGAKAKRVPDVVWSWCPELRRAFIRGYVDADGHLMHDSARGEVWRAASASPDLIRDVRDLALTCGVRPGTVTSGTQVTQPPNSPAPVISTMHKVVLTFAPEQAEGRSLTSGGHPAPRHLRYERVRAIISGPVAPVYDLTVEGTESFVAEGFFVHNTRWHPDDLAGQLLRQQETAPDPDPRLQWTLLNFPALSGLRAQGKPIPDALHRPPGEWLVTMRGHEQNDAAEWQSIRRDLDPVAFSAVYLGAPFLAESGAWSQDTIDTYRVAEPPPNLVRKAVAVDPAETGTGDESGIVVGGRDARTPPHLYVLADVSGPYGVDEWPRRSLLAALEHDVDDLVWEKNRFPQGERLLRAEWALMVRDAQIIRALREARNADRVTPDEDVIDTAVAVLLAGTDPAKLLALAGAVPDAAVALAPLVGAAPDELGAEGTRIGRRLRELWPRVGKVLRHGHTCPYRLIGVTATRGKATRADPVVQVYAAGRVHHVGPFVVLEGQQVSWLPGMDSPDRLDADVWLCTHLLQIGGPARVGRPDQLPPIPTRSAGRGGRR